MDTKETMLVRNLRDPDLPRGMRGYQEEPTQDLLRKAAAALERLATERDNLRRELEAKPAPASEVEDSDGERPDADAIGRALLTATSMGDQMIADAKKQADQRVAEAEAEAERLLSAARTEADELERDLASARAKLERELTDEARRLEQQLVGERSRLERELEQLQRETDTRRERVEAEREELLAGAKEAAEQILADARADVARLREEADGLDAFLDEKKRAFVEIARAALDRLDALEVRNNGASEKPDEIVSDLRRPVETRSSEPDGSRSDRASAD